MTLVLPTADWPLATTIAALGLCALTAWILAYAYPRLRETTLISAWWWALAATAGLAGCSLLSVNLGSPESDLLDASRFAAAALTFCPIVSVLGSKRPQHKAWNFIVLSLWVVVTLPAGEMLLLQRGQGLEVNDARGWFLWILLVLLPVNYVPTRYWFACLAVTCGQFLLLSEHLPLVRGKVNQVELISISLVTIAAWSALVVSRRPAAGASRFDRVWLDFRDSFGLLWGLRVAERVNTAAKQLEWPIELRWQGFRNFEGGESIGEVPSEVHRPLKQTLSGLLRRFVSSSWITKRSAGDVD